MLRFAALSLMAVGVLVACASQEAVSWDDQVQIGPVGEPVETVEHVGYYPACGNEPVEVNGVTWFPITPTEDSELPADPLAATPGGAAAASGGTAGPAGMSRAILTMPLPAVVEPGPGDDIGTLVVFEGGLAFWRSDSGDLETWLTSDTRSYNWVC